MQCSKPIHFGFTQGQGYRTIPCGKCIMCRIKRTNEWTLRMLHELDYHKESCFITLTYEDDSPNYDGILHKEHLQKFFKRLRKYLGKKRIKYFSCGEYGSDTLRPHYHAIIFGHKFKNDIPLKKGFWRNLDLEKLWKEGFSVIAPCNRLTLQYVAKYIQKYNSDDSYRQEKFSLISKGIGERFVKDEGMRIMQIGKLTQGGTQVSIPRYYLKKLEKFSQEDSYAFRYINQIEADKRAKENLEHHSKEEFDYHKASHEVLDELKNKVLASRKQKERRYEAKNKFRRAETC